MALTPARKKANEKYIDNNYSSINIRAPKDEVEVLSKYCEERGITKAGFIRTAIKEKMERDG